MSESDRREFLKKLAITTAYVAPAVKTMAAPDPAAAQALSKKMGGMMTTETTDQNMGFMKGFDMIVAPDFPKAPWDTSQY